MKSARISLAAVLTLSLSPMSALAHAHLSKASPAENSDTPVAQAPKGITLQFSEAVEPAICKIEVRAEGSKEAIATDETLKVINATTLESDFKKPLAPGKYTVSWAATATDSHKSNGKYRFTVR